MGKLRLGGAELLVLGLQLGLVELQLVDETADFFSGQSRGVASVRLVGRALASDRGAARRRSGALDALGGACEARR